MTTGDPNRGLLRLNLVTIVAAGIPLALGINAWWRSDQFELLRTFGWPVAVAVAALLTYLGFWWARWLLGLVCTALTARLGYTAFIASTINATRSALTVGLAIAVGACAVVVFSSPHLRAFVQSQRGGGGG